MYVADLQVDVGCAVLNLTEPLVLLTRFCHFAALSLLMLFTHS